MARCTFTGETICFGSLEFTADRFDRLSLSPEGNDSGTAVIGMVHIGSPSLHIALEESSDKGNAALCDGGSSGFPVPRGCNVVTLIVPITTIGEHSDTSNHLNGPAVNHRTTTRYMANPRAVGLSERATSMDRARQINVEPRPAQW
jgi:hypothetical protein